ncbi:MAG: bifunctional adenosylcobinamide kinase/adenosylcobinamide-phosphate guanylyltransferase [Pseudomonadota bacterium]
MAVTLILGGARSGKSSRAQALAEAESDTRTFIATAEALDDEMAERIARHQSDRGKGWTTIDAPLSLADALRRSTGKVVLVDCLTLWLSNVMHHERDPDQETARLLETFDTPKTLILVSNEVGFGLVPETRLGRRFRDAQGRLNQAVAAACDRVELVVAGLPLVLK